MLSLVSTDCRMDGALPWTLMHRRESALKRFVPSSRNYIEYLLLVYACSNPIYHVPQEPPPYSNHLITIVIIATMIPIKVRATLMTVAYSATKVNQVFFLGATGMLMVLDGLV